MLQLWFRLTFEDDDQKSDLVFMSGDPDSKWGGIASTVYLKAIEEQLPTLWEPDPIFM